MRGIVAALCVGQTFVSGQTELSLNSRNGTLRVVIVGDVGSGTERVAAGIAKIGAIDAIIIPGDNVYPCGVQTKDDPRWRVLEPLTKFSVPLFTYRNASRMSSRHVLHFAFKLNAGCWLAPTPAWPPAASPVGS